jgi:phage terminase small subunit
VSNRNAGSNARKSRQHHELAGSLRKDRHGDLRNPEPTLGRPEAPAALDKLAQETWDRLMWAFEDMGMLMKVDAEAVYAYAQLWSETEHIGEQQGEARASLRILEENLGDIEAEDKVQLFSQIVTLQKLISKCTDQLRQGRMAIRQYLVEFGLTPASRGRIKLPAKAEAADDFEQHQKLRRVK